MRRIRRIMAAALVMAMVVTLVPATNTYAASKKAKVTYTLKNGTLTIKGKGKMPKDMKFVKNKKIKKVVIKKGVTSISDEAFRNCKKLKEVTIPNTVKKIGIESFYGTALKEITIPSSVKSIGQYMLGGSDKLKTITMPGIFNIKQKDGDEAIPIINGTSVDTIKFNTPLQIKNVSYLKTNNLVVNDKDELFKSIDGVIYTKDGKGIVRVPSRRNELIIEDGCIDFNISSLVYAAEDMEGDPIGGCHNFGRIVIPESVENINDTKYKSVVYGNIDVTNFDIKTKKLDGRSIDVLSSYCEFENYTLNKISEQLPELVILKDNVYKTSDGILLKYKGTARELKVENDIKEIGISAFQSNDTLEKIELPDSIEKIDKKAFCSCYELKEITIPKSVKIIEDWAFMDCNELGEIVIPYTVKELGKRMFAGSGLKKAVLPNGITNIPEYMFEFCSNLTEVDMPDTVEVVERGAFFYCESLDITSLANRPNLKEVQTVAFMGTKWNNLVIPENVKVIEKYAFDHWNGDSKDVVTVKGSTKQISAEAFPDENVKIIYEKGIKQAKANLEIYMVKWKKKHAVVQIRWSKIANVSGYQVQAGYDGKFKKGIKTVYAGKNKVTVKIKISQKYKPVYARIRPYKIVKGKKVYGKWTNKKDL